MKTPLNVLIFNDLLEKIKSQHYKSGELLPTEQQMEEIYGTSRAPVRQALGRLEVEGVITRRAGVGTMVSEKRIDGPWTTMFGFADHLMHKWNLTHCMTVNVEIVTSTGEISEKLNIPLGRKIVHTKRIRVYNGRPIFYLEHFLPNGSVDKIREKGNFNNMRTILTDTFKLDLSHVSEELEVVQAPSFVAKELKVEIGYPLLKIKRITYSSNFNPIEYLQYYVKTDDWKYRVIYSQEGLNARQ